MNDLNHGIILETSIRTLKLEAFFTMTAAKTAAAMAVGLLTTLSVASLAQNGQDQPATANPTANATALVLSELATVDWIEKSDVAALREGVIEKMELRLGDPASSEQAYRLPASGSRRADGGQEQDPGRERRGDREGQGDRRGRRFAGGSRQAAQRPEAGYGLGRRRGQGRGRAQGGRCPDQGSHGKPSRSPRPSSRWPEQILKEHTIVAPFDGVVIKRMKNPGESVRANEAVVQLGKLSRLCANAYVPLEHAFRVKEGQVVEIQPKVDSADGGKRGDRERGSGARSPSSIPRSRPIAETAGESGPSSTIQTSELLPGLKVQMTIYLTDDARLENTPAGRSLSRGHRWAKSILNRIFPEDC